MRVRIDKAEKDSWYESQVGSNLNVCGHVKEKFYSVIGFLSLCILKSDCTVLQEESEEPERHFDFVSPINNPELVYTKPNFEHPSPSSRQPFDLTAYNTGKYEVETRDGRKVRILATDLKNKQYCICGVMDKDDEEWNVLWQPNGEFEIDRSESPHDLFLIPKQVSKWVNYFKSEPFSDKHTADLYATNYYSEESEHIYFIETKEIKTNE